MMAKCYVEHANITVSDLDEAVRFLTAAIPSFHVRGEGISDGRRWVHVGDKDTYIALNEAAAPVAGRQDYDQSGFNHIGFVVEDAGAVAEALRQAGFKEGFKPDPHPHRLRVYFLDVDGNEWEFVQYFSDDPAERNDYLQ